MSFAHAHLLGIEQLNPFDITTLLDLAEVYVDLNRRDIKHSDALTGLTQINMFFENSTRTRMSFETAMKRLGGSVLNFSSVGTSVSKGETLYDTMQMISHKMADYSTCRGSKPPARAARPTMPDPHVVLGFVSNTLPSSAAYQVETRRRMAGMQRPV